MIAGVPSRTFPAAAAQPFWAALPLADRGRYLARAAQVVLDVSPELAGFLTREHRRTASEAWALELLPGVDALHWAARAGSRALAPQRIGAHTAPARLRRSRLVRAPLGVVGVVLSARAPWAWPLERVAVALMAGNGVLLPPGPAAERMVRVFERAGVPDGLVSLAERDLTGLARVWDDAAEGLEAKGPMLVCADADLDRAAAAAAWGAFGAGGRMPAGVSAAWVAAPVAEAFTARVRAHAGARAQIVELTEPGGALDLPADPPGTLGVVSVPGDEEALAGATAGPRGGAASVWSRDRGRAERLARSLGTPVIWVNDHANPIRGRSDGRFAEATRASVLVLPPLGSRPLVAPWWPPEDRALPRALAAAGTLLYGRDADRAAALRDGLRPLGRLAVRTLRRRRSPPAQGPR